MRNLFLVQLLLLGSSIAEEQEDEEGRATLLLYKKLNPTEDFGINKPINVTITVFNKGPGNAYSLMVADDNWKADKFRVVSGGNNFTLDFLNAGDSYEHEFVVTPIRKMWHRVRPAKMHFFSGVEGEKTIMHQSNSLSDIRVVEAKDSFRENLLIFGRLVSFNTIKTKEGWTFTLVLACIIFGLQLKGITASVLQKRRHLRALDDVKNM